MKGAIIYLQRRKPGDPLIEEYTQLMLEEIERLDLFVTEFLYFAKQSAPKPVLTNLNELIQNTLTLFDERLRQKRIVVTENLDPALSSVYVDPHQMEQVLLNLVINAIDAMPQGGASMFQAWWRETVQSLKRSFALGTAGSAFLRTSSGMFLIPFTVRKKAVPVWGYPSA